jgi:adenylyl cyclase-associated protein
VVRGESAVGHAPSIADNGPQEHYDGTETNVVDVQMKQSVYIYNCNNATIIVSDKCKSIQIGAPAALPFRRARPPGRSLSTGGRATDKCTKTRVIFNQVVSTFEVVNSKRIDVTVSEACPSMTIDKSAGVVVRSARPRRLVCSRCWRTLNRLLCALQVHLTSKAMEVPPQIITANSTEVNVSIPGATAEADPVEMPVAEQFLTVVRDGKLVTEAIVHKG